MKLNQKGYMLVEIVLSAVLAMSIAYYLLNLTYKFNNTNADLYESIVYMNYKTIITKNIMQDLEQGNIVSGSVESNLSSSESNVSFVLVKEDGFSEKRKLEVKDSSSGTVIEYGKWDSTNGFYTEDISYYKKVLPSIMIVEKIELKSSSTNGLGIKIPISSIYDEQSYDIKIFS